MKGPSREVKYRSAGKTHADTYRIRAELLNGMTYEQYLRSPQWESIKAKAARRPYYSNCRACKSDRNINLHHVSYRFIGTHKEMTEIIPLCAQCHISVHELAKYRNISVTKATKQYIKEARELASWFREKLTAALDRRA